VWGGHSSDRHASNGTANQVHDGVRTGRRHLRKFQRHLTIKQWMCPVQEGVSFFRVAPERAQSRIVDARYFVEAFASLARLSTSGT
jgi:hypothetical protein